MVYNLNFILNTGVKQDLENYLVYRIKISNQVALLMAFVGLCYSVFSIYFYPSLTIYPAICVFLSLAAISLNKFGFSNLARLLLSNLIILLAFLYHAYLVQPGEPAITGMTVIEFALSAIPWILIDFRERTLLTISLFICYALIFMQPFANEWLHMNLDSSLMREGFLNVASIGFATLILVACLFFTQSKNLQSELSNEQLLKNINEKNTELDKQRTTLEENLEEIEKARAAEYQQNWVSRGVSDISDLLRKEKEENIYNVLLRAIVKYLGANQGCIFMLNDSDAEDVHLEMAACYAYERTKHLSKRIEIGQGLIGQCYLEKETATLREVPDDFVTITSGLGEALPTFVTIVPMMQESKVVGVMEFGLFKDVQDYQLEFLEKIGQNIAAFSVSNSMNVKTKVLLSQSQEQMEQLRAQEEEMRQNMEELQATQEEMIRKEREYLERIEALEGKQSEQVTDT